MILEYPKTQAQGGTTATVGVTRFPPAGFERFSRQVLVHLDLTLQS